MMDILFPLIMILIVYANTREDAIMKMKRALEEYVIEGIKTNIDFHCKILNNKDYINGEVHTGFLNEIK